MANGSSSRGRSSGAALPFHSARSGRLMGGSRAVMEIAGQIPHPHPNNGSSGAKHIQARKKSRRRTARRWKRS